MPKVSQFDVVTSVSPIDDYVPIIELTGTAPDTYRQRKVLKGNLYGSAVTYTSTGNYYPDDGVGFININQATGSDQIDVHLPLIPPGNTIAIYVQNITLIGIGYVRIHAPSGKKIDKAGTTAVGRDSVLLPKALGAAYGPVVLMATPNQDYAYASANVGSAGMNFLFFHSSSVSLPNGTGWQPWPNLAAATIIWDDASMWNASATPTPGFNVLGVDAYMLNWSLGQNSPLVIPAGVSLEIGLGFWSVSSYQGGTRSTGVVKILMDLKSNIGFHYDEALKDLDSLRGGIPYWRITSWQERRGRY